MLIIVCNYTAFVSFSRLKCYCIFPTFSRFFLDDTLMNICTLESFVDRLNYLDMSPILATEKN